MCGLVGIAGKLEFKDEATMKRLLLLDYFRGPDSTGFAALRNSGDVKLVKMATHPIDFFDSKSFIDALSGYNSRVFLGHNRLATLGKVNGLNAHPFRFGNIIGAHNGTLDTDSWLRLEEASGVKTDVDSAAIFACIDKIGVEDTVKLMEEGRTSQKGAWALTWFDLEKGTVNFLRNRHRPFWYAYSEDFNKVLWASEWHMIRAAAGMSTHDYKLHVDKGGFSFWETEEDVWYRFDLEELMEGGKKMPKPKVKKVKGREPTAVVSTYTGGGAPFHQNGSGGRTTTTTGSQTTSGTDRQSTDQGPSHFDLIGTKTNPLGGAISRDRFEELAKYGCSWCQSTVEWGDKGLTVNECEDIVLCGDCSGNGKHSRVVVSGSAFSDKIESLAA